MTTVLADTLEPEKIQINKEFARCLAIKHPLALITFDSLRSKSYSPIVSPSIRQLTIFLGGDYIAYAAKYKPSRTP